MKPGTERDQLDERVPEDDRVIGRAIVRSLLTVCIVVVLSAVTWLALREKPVRPPPVETIQVSPQSMEISLEHVPPAVIFRDVTGEAGIDFVPVNGAYGERLLPETMGGGVAFIDYDEDGLQDLLFVNGTNWPWHSESSRTSPALYRNRGDGSFENVTSQTGLIERFFFDRRHHGATCSKGIGGR